MPTMTALRAHHRGGPEVLVVEEAPRPVPGPGQVLVAVLAAGVTFTELEWPESWERSGHDRTPVVPSHEFAGRVAAVAPGTDDVTVGDRVYGWVPFDRDGAAAEYVVAGVGDLAAAPLSLSAREAAALPMSGVTAWQALTDHGRLQAGQQLLVHGGAGGVGAFAVQLGRSLGAEVTATCRHHEVASVRALGAQHVLDADHESFDTSGQSWDLVLDTVGGSTLERSWAVVRAGGRLITLREPPSQDRAHALGIHATFFIVRPDRAGLTAIARLADAGDLRVVIAATYPLAEGRAAYAAGARADRPAGKTVIVVSDGEW